MKELLLNFLIAEIYGQKHWTSVFIGKPFSKTYLVIVLLFAFSTYTFCSEEECIYDQNAFSKEWIKSKSELKKYVWDEKIRAFGVVLNPNEYLRISGGGCVHYGEAYKLMLYHERASERPIKFYKNKLIELSKLVLSGKNLERVDKQIKALNFEKLNKEKEFSLPAFPYESFGIEIQIFDSQTIFEINWYQN